MPFASLTETPAFRRLAALAPWAISIGSLTLGLLTLFVFRRGLPHVQWIVGYLLLVVLLTTLVAELRVPLQARGHGFVVGAAEYLLQTLCHGLFLFVLPAYYAATTLTSPNVALLALLAVSALLTTIDPWYRAVVHPRAWLRAALFGLAMFGGLNVALALLGMRAGVAAVAAAGLAGFALSPALRGSTTHRWFTGLGRGAAIATVAMMFVWLFPICIPPAPMFMAHAAVARDVVTLQPVDVVDDRIDAAAVRRWGALAAYTAVYAPAGLHAPIEHVWRRDGAVIARIPLSPIMGGRRDGFRTFSRTHVREPIAGRYQVDVMTASGQLIGRIRFTVTP